MNAQTAERIDDLIAKGSQEVIEIDRAMLLRVYRRDGVPVLMRWEHIIPLGPAPVPVGYFGIECDGVMALHPDYGSDIWVVEQEQPLTLSPSMSCRHCGAHGHVIDGKFIGRVSIPSPEVGQ